MKRKVIVSITFVVLLCSIVLCVINQKKAPFIEGVIVKKNERFFTIETDIQLCQKNMIIKIYRWEIT